MQFEDSWPPFASCWRRSRRNPAGRIRLHDAGSGDIVCASRTGALSALFPNGDFDSPIWDVRHLRTSRHKTSNSRVHFTRYGSETDGLPTAFCKRCKSLLDAEPMYRRNDVVSSGYRAHALGSHRFSIRRLAWIRLVAIDEEDLLKTEQVMLAHWSPSTTYKRSTQLQFMMRSLAAAPVAVSCGRWKSYSHAANRRLRAIHMDGQLERMKRLPSDGAIQAVCDIYAKYAREPRDRLIACVLAVMLATAFRIGEALTLPLDCLCSEGTGTRKRWEYGTTRKSPRRAKQLAVRWMTPKQAELAGPLFRKQRS